MDKKKEFLDYLLERFQIERKKFDRSGIYGYTQRLLAYNSNKIEGSTDVYKRQDHIDTGIQHKDKENRQESRNHNVKHFVIQTVILKFSHFGPP